MKKLVITMRPFTTLQKSVSYCFHLVEGIGSIITTYPRYQSMTYFRGDKV